MLADILPRRMVLSGCNAGNAGLNEGSGTEGKLCRRKIFSGRFNKSLLSLSLPLFPCCHKYYPQIASLTEFPVSLCQPCEFPKSAWNKYTRHCQRAMNTNIIVFWVNLRRFIHRIRVCLDRNINIALGGKLFPGDIAMCTSCHGNPSGLTVYPRINRIIFMRDSVCYGFMAQR